MQVAAGGEGAFGASAAGMLANAARRRGAVPGARDAVLADLHAAAALSAVKVERLRMTDYLELHRRRLVETELAVVLATFNTWKHARAVAAQDPSLAAT